MSSKKDFSRYLSKVASNEGIELSANVLDQLQIYFEVLTEWNKKIDLTSITGVEEVAIKHFLDSLMLLKYVDFPQGAKIIDVGTGAGFPGMVLKIVRPDLHISLLDSLNKRLRFIAEIESDLNLRNLELLHFRAETAGKMELYREKFDFALARAVAPMIQLLEYCVPFVKVDGTFVAMKSRKAKEEVELSENAAAALGSRLEKMEEFSLPCPECVNGGESSEEVSVENSECNASTADPGMDEGSEDVSNVSEKSEGSILSPDFMYRCLVFYSKFHSTPKRYPRQTGQIRKKVLGEVRVNG